MNNSIIESCNVYFTYCVTGGVGQKKTTLENEENFVVKASIGLLRFSKYFHDSASTLANLCAYFQAIDMYAGNVFHLIRLAGN